MWKSVVLWKKKKKNCAKKINVIFNKKGKYVLMCRKQAGDQSF